MINHLTPEINAAFIATGCMRVLNGDSEVHYYHSENDLYLRYAVNLRDEQFKSYTNLTEIVLVVDNDEALREAYELNPSCDVVKLQELEDFLLYRTFSEECTPYRAAKARYEAAEDEACDADGSYKSAKRKHELAVERFNVANIKFSIANKEYLDANVTRAEASAEFWSTRKPPRYRHTSM